MASLIKCPSCGVYNQNVDYCIHCGTLISSEKRRELKLIKEEETQLERSRLKKEQASASFDKYKNHKYFIVRAFAEITRTIWMVFIGIGIVFAWIFAAVAI